MPTKTLKQTKTNRKIYTQTHKKGPSMPPPSTYKPPTPTSTSYSIWNLPTNPTTTTTRRTTTTTTTRRLFTTRAPFYNPSDPSYNGGGSFFGNRYGDTDNSGGISSFFGGSNRPTTPTRRPSSGIGGGSSSSGGGFFSGLGDALQGELGKILSGAISGNRGGTSGSSGGSSLGGFGSFFKDFNTRPVQENKRFGGGLFSENTGNSGSSSSNDGYNKYPVTRYGDVQQQAPTQAPSQPSYGWKLS